MFAAGGGEGFSLEGVCTDVTDAKEEEDLGRRK